MVQAQHPYELSEDELQEHLEEMVDVTFADLTSQFMLMPRGPSFVTYVEFRAGYETLRMKTDGFCVLTADNCWQALREDARCFVVLRAILGVSPPEWQDLTVQEIGTQMPRMPRVRSTARRRATLSTSNELPH